MSTLALGAGLAGLTGCQAYVNLMGSLPMTGSVKAVNTMSVPVCKITVYSTTEPGVKYDNMRNAKVFLGPGEEGQLSYPIAKDEKGAPKSDSKYGMRVYGCEKQAYDMGPGAELADVREVDVHGQQVVLR